MTMHKPCRAAGPFIEVLEGTARYGKDTELFLIEQGDGLPDGENVLLSPEDLQALKAAAERPSLDIELEDGSALYMGDDLWVIQQFDGAALEYRSVTIACGDVDRMLT